MKERGRMKQNYLLALLILTGLVGLGISIFYSPSEIGLSPVGAPTGFLTLDVPLVCSNASVAAMWDKIFLESSSGTRVFVDSGGDRCGEFVAYKNVDTRLWILSGRSFTNTSSLSNGTLYGNHTTLSGRVINFTNDSYLGFVVGNLSVVSDLAGFKNFDSKISSSQMVGRDLSIAGASNTWSATFRFAPPVSWTLSESGRKKYIFNETANSSNGNLTDVFSKSGEVYGNESLDIADYAASVYEFRPTCTPQWIAVNASCNATTETYLVHYYDNRSCGITTGMPANQTLDCDANGNGLIGVVGDVYDSNVNVDVYINGSRVNSTGVNYTGTKSVEIKEGSVVRVSFTHDFSDEPLKLRGIEVMVQPSSPDEGYIVVNGIEERKTVRINRIDNTTGLCVKDGFIDSINDISSDCGENDEDYLDCPGSVGSYSCSISGRYYVLSGLRHSAAIEMDEEDTVYSGNNGGPSGGACAPRWSCVTWGACINGVRTMNCVDLRNCGTTSGRPNITEACAVSAGGCTPSWNCKWAPEECPESELQIYECTDANNCGNVTGRPSSTRTCNYEPPKTWAVIAVILVSLALVVLVVVLLVILKRRKRQMEI